MPAISKIRMTNIIYEGGGKRFNDEIFEFDGHNGVILLENGGGKTVLIQTALQAILPHLTLGERKIKDTLSLEGGPGHIAIEWILKEKPRRYGLTAISLYLSPTGIKSLRYVYEYSSSHDHSIENIPFTKKNPGNTLRSASRQEIQEYYQYMQGLKLNAYSFDTINSFHEYIEENFQIIPSEWKNIALINGAEGDVEKFFDKCRTTSELVDRMLIPTVEEAIVGNGTQDFAQIFERQREHFKKHKELRTRIDESKKIEERIRAYVFLYEKYHGIEEKMMAKKSQGKSIYEFLQGEEGKVLGDLSHIKDLEEILGQEKTELTRKKLSFKLAQLERDLKKAQDSYQIILREYGRVKEDLDNKKERYQNLEIARLKASIKEEEERIERLNSQINELDEDIESLNLKERLDENSSILRAYYEDQLESFKKQKQMSEGQKRNYQEELKESYQKEKQLQIRREGLLKDSARYEGEIKTNKKDINDINKKILLNPSSDTIEGEVPKWKDRLREIEGLKLDHNQYLENLRGDREELSMRIPGLDEKIKDLIKEISRKESHFEDIQNRQEDILSTIKNLRIDWQYLENIYLKQQSIIDYMEERLEKTIKEKEDLLEKERISYRLLDYYGHNKYFTGEPQLELWVENWTNQFHLLELGTSFIEKIANESKRDLDSLYKKYPLWPLVIITSEGEVDKLYKRLESQRRDLISPILILSQKEANKIILEDNPVEERYIYPSIWQENIDRERFERWKEELLNRGQEIGNQRKNKEREESDWQNRLKTIKDFLDDNPYEKYSQLKEDIQELNTQLKDKKDRLERNQRKIINIDRERKAFEDKLKALDQETSHLEQKVENSLEYFRRKEEVRRLTVQLLKTNEEIEKIDSHLLLNKKDKERLEEILKDIEETIRDITIQSNKIYDEDYFIEVKDFQPIYRDIEKGSIIGERTYIKDRLNEKQKDRPLLEEQLKEARKNKESGLGSLEQKRKRAQYPIDEGLAYPYNGKELEDDLGEDTYNLKKRLEAIGPNKNKLEKEYERQNHRFQLRKEDFHEEFEEVIIFTQPLLTIKEEIEAKGVDLDQREKKLKSESAKFATDLKDIQANIQSMEVENGRYEFLESKVKASLLDPNLIQGLPYKRKDIIANIISELEGLRTSLDNHRDKVNTEKNNFIQFLNENPIDIRLREMTKAGIRNKEDFNEILEWQANMEKTLNRVIKIHEQNIIEHDKELNQFIQYLYSYLATLANEIGAIPKNTKVKIEDTWKEIFQIQIPDWDEDQGKVEIRKHVDWMIGQLEEGEFIDEEGNEDVKKIKAAIEKWLQPKQLLNIILLGEEIKVRCRKVTNDGRVSGSYYSWPNSNQWSGGEKWSKNMALFLGILNYSAEKKQHIVASQKSNRTVILDNPFGKASSDHVLNPVFFIAQQLGFQFIVLTAHGDGRYIRDYFPVVYSCKLRPSVEGDTSILTKEKTINYAFLKDNDPMAIERIGEREQISLF